MSAPSTTGADIDALFKLPLGEFTSARNALAAQLKKAGRRAEADEVKALAKPSVSAWAVNQLRWQHGDLFGRLIAAGERLRQGGKLTSDSIRETVNERRQLVTTLAGIAEKMLRHGDYGATHSVRRIASTLEALSSYGSLPGAPVAGRLSGDVDPPGFEALAGVLPLAATDSAATPTSSRASLKKPAPKPMHRAERSSERSRARDAENERKRLLAEAKAAVRKAEQSLSLARKQVERADARQSAAAQHAESTEEQRAQIEKQLVRASQKADAARQEISQAEADAAEATQAMDGAELALQQARRRLEQLVG